MKNKIFDWIWFKDYIRTTDDKSIVISHLIKDFIFYHRIRYMFYLRLAQTTHIKIIRLICNYKIYRMSRKYGIEIKSNTEIGPGFVMIHPYNITISTFAKIGKNVNMMKGSTIGLSSGGKRPGAPIIGNSVYIGINATVVGGVKIGNDVLIAPNTFVNEDIPDHSVVIGSPCIIKHKMNATSNYIFYKVD